MEEFYVFLSIVFWLACGVFSVYLRNRKGYSGGFVSGFLFGVFAVLYNISLPDLVLEKEIAKLKAELDRLSRNYFKKDDKHSEPEQNTEKSLNSNERVAPLDQGKQCCCPICNFPQPKGRAVCWKCGVKFDQDKK